MFGKREGYVLYKGGYSMIGRDNDPSSLPNTIWFDKTTNTTMLDDEPLAETLISSTSDTQILFNDSGDINGSSNLVFNKTDSLKITGEDDSQIELDSDNGKFSIKNNKNTTNSLYPNSLTLNREAVGTEIITPLTLACVNNSIIPSPRITLMSGMTQDTISNDFIRDAYNSGIWCAVNATYNRSAFKIFPQTTSPVAASVLSYNSYINAMYGVSQTYQDGSAFDITTHYMNGLEIKTNKTGHTAEDDILETRITIKPDADIVLSEGSQLRVMDDSNSSSKTTGSIITQGGISTAKSIYAGASIYAPNLTQANSTGKHLVMQDESSLSKIYGITSLAVGSYGNPMYYSSSSNRIYENTSSERYKEDIQPASNFSDFILDVEMVTYKLRAKNEFDKSDDDKKIFTGVIAEQIYRLNPEAVEYTHLSDNIIEKNKWQDYVIKRTTTFPGKPNKVVNAPRLDYFTFALIEQNKMRKQEIDDLLRHMEILQANFETLQEDFIALSKQI